MSKILLFGENPNDTLALQELILGLCPGLSRSELRVLRRPPTLQRGAKTRAIQAWTDGAVRAIRAAQVAFGEVRCIFVHTDADGPDDGSFAAERSAELQRAGLDQAHAIVPVQAIEAWWLLFPIATETVVRSWRGALKRSPGEVDTITAPKEELIRRTRSGQRARPYQERDSVTIAEAIVSGGYLNRRPAGVSRSFEEFRRTVVGCCDA